MWSRSRSKAARATLELIARAGGAASFEKTDVGSWDDVDALIGRTVARHGRLDVMVNNAAIFSGTALLETSAAQWEQVMSVNLTGMFNGCKRAIQQMITQEPRNEVRGRVINLGSQQGIVTAPRDTPYGVSKAGAIYLTKQIAVDYAQDLIVCNCISPGKIVTGQPWSAHGPGSAGERPPPHALAAPRPAAGHRQRRGVSGQRPRHLHHRLESGGRRRLAGALAVIAGGAVLSDWRMEYSLPR